MRFVPLALLLTLLAGCASEPPADAPPTEQEATPEPVERVFLDINWTYVNDAPTVFATDREITTFDLPEGVRTMVVTMERFEAPPELFAAAGRAYGPQDEFDQAAFNPGTAPEGQLELSFDEPAAGEWLLAYVTEEGFPQGRHAVHVQVRILA